MPSMANPVNAPPKNHQNQLNNRKGGDILRRQNIEKQRKSLPIATVEKRLVEEVHNNDTLIIVGETGSGKTTRKFSCSGMEEKAW
nr:pre-mRNA-splicing factor ATP-dependent RNA helicase DEAH10 [Ipomoea batatas]